MRKHGIIAAGLGVALAIGIGACGGKTAVHPSETSTPPAVSAPSETPSANGPDNSQQPTEDLTAPLTAKIGETFNVTTTDANDILERADVTVNKMTDLGGTIAPVDEYSDPEHATKGRFVVFTITYADTLGAFDYNEFDWTVRMPDGQEYGPGAVMSDLTAKFGQPLNSGTLHKDQRAKGTVTFDIPKTHGTLIYASGFEQTAEIKF